MRSIPAITVNFQGIQAHGSKRPSCAKRLMATLSGFFGLLALVLACIGLYGILSYGVASRTNEIGIDGARRSSAKRFWLSCARRCCWSSPVWGVGCDDLRCHPSASALPFGLTPT